ncbi:MAG: fumarylacetoacetate hydrolase family protein [Pseudomonadota bacterium]
MIEPPLQTAIPVVGGGWFPVRRVYCVGRNYADHAREMGADPDREPPFFFSKPRDALTGEATAPYPPATADLHYEVELVLALHHGGAHLSPAEAIACIYGGAVGVDLTRRDLQTEAKKAGRPWDAAKRFDHSAPIGHLKPGLPAGSGAITLTVNGQTRQAGDLAEMIWSPAETLVHLSGLFELMPGDLIYTGTPAGVGPIVQGDHVEARIDGLPAHSFTLV